MWRLPWQATDAPVPASPVVVPVRANCYVVYLATGCKRGKWRGLVTASTFLTKHSARCLSVWHELSPTLFTKVERPLPAYSCRPSPFPRDLLPSRTTSTHLVPVVQPSNTDQLLRYPIELPPFLSLLLHFLSSFSLPLPLPFPLLGATSQSRPLYPSVLQTICLWMRRRHLLCCLNFGPSTNRPSFH
ncbi:uncharacterized protein LY79DRAFT_154963 [Colletotrichum navitas]|uniref:Uncharacterized protein n=1 Tax=Colletotrichum navitas TaxID=681940 RepID=A0AAD8Q201_9PEZI|nr:uncharacterized protein LY79DRAFT_154963 [Colletotrichum navitas]KAK1594376.1 hypothetical protein LY79DRAFT_154963 [Colletotrichum navitas]